MNPKFIVSLKNYYSDDARDYKRGQGLAYVPLVSEALGQLDDIDWVMAPAEQMALIYLLEKLRPRVSIEIGTCFGGSLQVLSKLSEKVYSLDIDPEVPKRLAGKFNNVEYIIGHSRETIPPLVEKLQKEETTATFVLIDGDHSEAVVRSDIECILKIRPNAPLFIALHDSFNPECRRGMVSANWAANPYVHSLELDFVSGTVTPSPSVRGELWGGLALAVLLPEKRTGRFEITGRAGLGVELLEPMHNRLMRAKQVRVPLARRVINRLKRMASAPRPK